MHRHPCQCHFHLISCPHTSSFYHLPLSPFFSLFVNFLCMIPHPYILKRHHNNSRIFLKKIILPASGAGLFGIGVLDDHWWQVGFALAMIDCARNCLCSDALHEWHGSWVWGVWTRRSGVDTCAGKLAKQLRLSIDECHGGTVTSWAVERSTTLFTKGWHC